MKVVRENAFEKTNKKPRLSFNPELALISFRPTGSWTLPWTVTSLPIFELNKWKAIQHSVNIDQGIDLVNYQGFYISKKPLRKRTFNTFYIFVKKRNFIVYAPINQPTCAKKWSFGKTKLQLKGLVESHWKYASARGFSPVKKMIRPIQIANDVYSGVRKVVRPIRGHRDLWVSRQSSRLL